MANPPSFPSAKATPLSDAPLAILLEGVPERWQMNVVQILGRQITAEVFVDGYGAICAPAFVLSEAQARRLAVQILETLNATSGKT